LLFPEVQRAAALRADHEDFVNIDESKAEEEVTALMGFVLKPARLMRYLGAEVFTLPVRGLHNYCGGKNPQRFTR
jgi:hypothetical protein